MSKGKEEKSRKIRLGIDLNEDATQKFLAVKEDIGIESNADVVRCLIRDYYRKIKPGSE